VFSLQCKIICLMTKPKASMIINGVFYIPGVP
jgi:hypothetical protein